MNSERLLAIDIDGTLLDSAMNLHDQSRQALDRAREAGFHLVFATGRQYRSCVDLIKDVAPGAPAVLNSGALVKQSDTDETVFLKSVPEAIALAIAAQIEAMDFTPIIMMDGFVKGFDYVTTSIEGRTSSHARFTTKNRKWGLFVDALPETLPAPPTQVLALGAMEPLKGVIDAVRRQFGDQVDTRIIRAPQYSYYVFEAYAPDVHKWDAVQWVARRLGIADRAIAAIGDDINDTEMLRECGMGIAMGNAPDHVKAAADATVATCDDGGFAQAVALILDAFPSHR